MSPLDDGIDHRPLADLYVEFWKWRNKQGLPHIPAEELVNEDVTPEPIVYAHVAHAVEPFGQGFCIICNRIQLVVFLATIGRRY
jgi:hypothetical protein